MLVEEKSDLISPKSKELESGWEGRLLDHDADVLTPTQWLEWSRRSPHDQVFWLRQWAARHADDQDERWWSARPEKEVPLWWDIMAWRAYEALAALLAMAPPSRMGWSYRDRHGRGWAHWSVWNGVSATSIAVGLAHLGSSWSLPDDRGVDPMEAIVSADVVHLFARRLWQDRVSGENKMASKEFFQKKALAAKQDDRPAVARAWLFWSHSSAGRIS